MDEKLKRTDAYAALTRNGKDVTPRQHCVIIGGPDGIKLDRQLEFNPSRPALFNWHKGTFAVTYYTKPVGGEPIMARYIGNRLDKGDSVRLSPSEK